MKKNGTILELTLVCQLVFSKIVFFSGIMLVGNDITDNGDDDECSIFFSSCKALYINHDNLIPYEINEKQFRVW